MQRRTLVPKMESLRTLGMSLKMLRSNWTLLCTRRVERKVPKERAKANDREVKPRNTTK